MNICRNAVQFSEFSDSRSTYIIMFTTKHHKKLGEPVQLLGSSPLVFGLMCGEDLTLMTFM